MPEPYSDVFPDELIYSGNVQIAHICAPNSVAGRIDSFAEVMLEWFLLDSDTEKGIGQFLLSEKLDKILTEEDFVAIICGCAYVDKDLVQLISMKIPFNITLRRLCYLNFSTIAANSGAHMIISNQNVMDQIKEQVRLKKQKGREYQKEYKHKYYVLNKQRIREIQRKWCETHREQLATYMAQWYRDHEAQQREYHKEYRTKNAEQVAARKKKCYAAKKQQYLARGKRYYEENKDAVLTHQKQYYAAHKDHFAQKSKEHHEKNRERDNLQTKINYYKRKLRAIDAQKVCAVYLFLMDLKKKDKKEYLKLYTARQDPVSAMIRTCPALQCMDATKCPLCNWELNTGDLSCCDQRVLGIPNIHERLKQYIQQIQNKR